MVIKITFASNGAALYLSRSLHNTIPANIRYPNCSFLIIHLMPHFALAARSPGRCSSTAVGTPTLRALVIVVTLALTFLRVLALARGLIPVVLRKAMWPFWLHSHPVIVGNFLCLTSENAHRYAFTSKHATLSLTLLGVVLFIKCHTGPFKEVTVPFQTGCVHVELLVAYNRDT